MAVALDHIPLSAGEIGLVRAGVDFKQEIPLFHVGSFGEMHFLQVAGDTRAHLNGIDGFQSAWELFVIRDVPCDRIAHLYFRRLGRWRRLSLTSVAAGANRKR